jgi:tetratricopeptide (TPR) repeat protein
MLIAAALAVLLLGVALWPTPSPSRSGEAAAAQSIAEARGTVRHWSARIQADPRDFVAHERLAAALLRRFSQHGDPAHLTRAHEAAAAAVSLSATPSSNGLVVLSAAQSGVHDFEAAADSARRATELRPGSAPAWVSLSDALAALGQTAEARTALDPALRITPSLATYARSAILVAAQGDLDAARRVWSLAFTDTTNVRPEDLAWALAQRGAFERATGDGARAERSLREALAAYPATAAASVELARVEADRGDLEAAQARLEEVVRRQPTPVSARLLIEVASARGDRSAAATGEALLAAIEATYEAAGINKTPSALAPGGIRS